MKTASASPAERILVWDLPVRVFHWLFAASFAGAYLTGDSESWRLLHLAFGYTAAALVALRLVWGVAGSRYARFAQFVQGPSAVLAYLKSLLAGRPLHFVGHNPAGALAIVALLVLGALVPLSGHATYNELGGEWLEEVHEVLANLMLAVVIAHLLGVAVGSIAHRENLVRAMLTGRKRGEPAEAIDSPRAGFVVLLLAAVLGVWWTQWSDPGAALDRPGREARSAAHEDDDD